MTNLNFVLGFVLTFSVDCDHDTIRAFEHVFEEVFNCADRVAHLDIYVAVVPVTHFRAHRICNLSARLSHFLLLFKTNFIKRYGL